MHGIVSNTFFFLLNSFYFNEITVDLAIESYLQTFQDFYSSEFSPICSHVVSWIFLTSILQTETSQGSPFTSNSAETNRLSLPLSQILAHPHPQQLIP